MILIDTHVVIWLALEPARISTKARAVIEETRQRGEGVAIADITLFEITQLERRGRIQLTASLETFLSEIEDRFVVLPITARACVQARGLPGEYPKDAADRLIGATALVNGMALVTADADIRRSRACRTVW